MVFGVFPFNILSKYSLIRNWKKGIKKSM